MVVTTSDNKLSRVRVSVTNNNGFWIGWFDLLTLPFFKFSLWGVESKLGPLGTSATEWPIVPAPGDYDDGQFGGMKPVHHKSHLTKPWLEPGPPR
jgi:hypothetical protein